MSSYSTSYNPDVLSTLANLSSDEVFTPPHIANQMLDLLPQQLFRDKNTTFLDPATKSGVFLREITKRLIKGLENDIPDLQERIDHILHNQVFGIAITELTALLSRRSLYCSKFPNSKFSISLFDNNLGNISYNNIRHVWNGDRCKYCGASKSQYGRESDFESHAYQFIHEDKEIKSLKFDVIIGNPPYQLNTGGAQAQATPLYDKFVLQAIKLNPRYISMIIQSRWFTGGFGLKKFRSQMLKDKRMKIIHDFYNSSDVFPGVDIKGGVNYFLWDREHNGKCLVHSHEGGLITSVSERALQEEGLDIFIRYNGAISILKKILETGEPSFSDIVSAQKPFGLPTNFDDFDDDLLNTDKVKVYANKKVGFTSLSKIDKNIELVNKWKILAPKAIGSGEGSEDKIKTIISEPGSVCTETYIVLGTYESESEAKNAVTYIETKFFHFLVTLVKNTQDALVGVYRLVPLLDFRKSWSDKELYQKYSLTEEEIDFIESLIAW